MTPELAKIIEEEEAILQQILLGLREARKKSRFDFHAVALRFEELREEARSARAEDLPALFDQMNSQRAILEQAQDTELPNSRNPYFAHMELEENGKRRQLLLGHLGFLDVSGAPINDWRNAPIASLFFNYREGEEFEHELPGRLSIGRVTKRRLIAIKDEQLVSITTPHITLRRIQESEEWELIEAGSSVPQMRGGSGASHRAMSFGTGQSGKPSPEVSALLDPNQYAALTSHEDDPVLILGGAGSGKTTVALHRLASLNFRNRERFAQHKMIVIVPDEGLVRLSRKLLDSLSLHRVKVSSFDKFLMDRVYQCVRKLPRKICFDPPSAVTTLKRHPALRSVIETFCERQFEEQVKRLKSDLPAYSDHIALISQDLNGGTLNKMSALRSILLNRTRSSEANEDSIKTKMIHQAFDASVKRLSDFAKDRVDFFLDKSLMEQIVHVSNGTLRLQHLEELLKHTRDQIGESASKRYAGVDLEQIQTVDGGALSDEFVDDLSQTIDYEDFAIVAELRRIKLGLKRGEETQLSMFEHIVIDEAQDLAAIELSSLGACLTKTGTVSIAGDSVQQIDPSTSFESWDVILDQLRVPRVSAQHLTTSYRSPKPIAEFAHAILGPLAPKKPPLAVREGKEVSFSRFDNEGMLCVSVSDALSELVAMEPLASIAVIVRNFEQSKRFFKIFTDAPKVRLVVDGEFEFIPGVDIVSVSEVKGLEFDYVIIPDASNIFYPDTPESRRSLHVASTRAIHQLWLLASSEWSSTIPERFLGKV